MVRRSPLCKGTGFGCGGCLLHFFDGERVTGELADDGDLLAGMGDDLVLVGYLVDLAVFGDEHGCGAALDAAFGAFGVVLHGRLGGAVGIFDKTLEFSGQTGGG